MLFNLANKDDRIRAEAQFKKLAAGGKRIVLAEKRPVRTLSQNALLHLWIKVIAGHLGYTSLEDCKTDIKRTLLGCRMRFDIISCEVVKDEYRTSEMSPAELSGFMDTLKAWALQEFNISLPYFGEPGYEDMVTSYFT